MLNLRFVWESATFRKRERRYEGLIEKHWYVEAGAEAKLHVYFPSQHLAEQAFTSNPLGVGAAPIAQTVFSPESRLLFSVYADLGMPTNLLRYNLTTLLTWPWDMCVVPRALAPGQNISDPTKVPPEADYRSQTYLIMPWHMVLSPHAKERWKTNVGPTGPVTGKVELWHARLTDSGQPAPSIRVIDTLDPVTPGAGQGDPFTTLPAWSDRQALKIETTTTPLFQLPTPPTPPEASTDPDDSSGDTGQPRSVDVKELMLSSQGAYANLHVAWSNPELIPYEALMPSDPNPLAPPGTKAPLVDEWKQRTIWGRDQEVVVAHPGYVMPFGHPASLVHARERRIFKDGYGKPYALLFDHYYCVIRQTIIDNFRLAQDPPNTIQGADKLSRLQRNFAFTKVTLGPRVTPDLRPTHLFLNPYTHQVEVDMTMADWMYLSHPNDPPITLAGGQIDTTDTNLFKFKVEAVDCQNKTHHFELPLFWVPLQIGTCGPKVAGPAAEYNSSAQSRRTADMGGQRVGYISQATGQTEINATAHDSSVETRTMTFAVETETAVALPVIPPKTDWPAYWYQGFYPRLDFAKVHLDQAAAFDTGLGADGLKLTYHDALLAYGIGPDTTNGNELFAKIENGNLNYDAAKSGGIVTPSVSITALSRKFGPWNQTAPVGSPPGAFHALGNTPGFHPSDFFGTNALLLGADLLGLNEIAKDVEDTLDEIEKVPQMIGQVLAPLGKAVDEVELVIAQCQDQLQKILNASQDYISQMRARVVEYQTEAHQISDNIRSVLFDEVNATIQNTVLYQLTHLPFPDGKQLTERLRYLFLSYLSNQEELAEYYARILLADADVVAAMQTVWDDCDPILTVLQAKIPVVCTQLDQNATLAIQAEISHWKADLNTLLRSFNKTLAQYQAYQAAQLKNVADVQAKVLHALDPEVYYQKFCAALRPGLSALDKLANFPLGPMQDLSKSLDQAAQALHEPGKLLGEGTRLITDILGEVRSVIAMFTGGRSLHATSRVDLSSIQTALKDIFNDILQQVDPLNLRYDVEANLQDLATFLSNNGQASLGAAITQDVEKLLFDAVAGRYLQAFQTWKDDISADLTNAAGPTMVAVDNWVKEVGQEIQDALGEITKSLKETINEVEDMLPLLPKELAIDFDWTPDLKDNALFKASCKGTPAALDISAHVRKSLKPDEISQPPEITIQGELTNFTLNLIPEMPVLNAYFDSVTFKSVNGHSPDVQVSINSIELAEALKFLADLAKALNPKNGPFLQQIERGIEAGFRFALPSITCAAFNIYNLKLVTGLQLWFDGSPMSMGLAICERDRPFVLAFGIFGGGGFVGLTLTPNGIETIEASLEFGAYVTLDLGVATGSGSVAAGIYFSTTTIQCTHNRPGKITKLYGYVHAHGEMSILGMISLIEDFYLGIGYESRDGESLAVGEVIVSVEIDFCFFSISVDIHFRKEYHGSGASAPSTDRKDNRLRAAFGRRDIGAKLIAPAADDTNPHDANTDEDTREMELLDNWEEYQSYFYGLSS